MYQKERASEAEVFQKKYGELRNALERAEEMWLKAQDKLEKAQK